VAIVMQFIKNEVIYYDFQQSKHFHIIKIVKLQRTSLIEEFKQKCNLNDSLKKIRIL